MFLLFRMDKKVIHRDGSSRNLTDFKLLSPLY